MKTALAGSSAPTVSTVNTGVGLALDRSEDDGGGGGVMSLFLEEGGGGEVNFDGGGGVATLESIGGGVGGKLGEDGGEGVGGRRTGAGGGMLAIGACFIAAFVGTLAGGGGVSEGFFNTLKIEKQEHFIFIKTKLLFVIRSSHTSS